MKIAVYTVMVALVVIADGCAKTWQAARFPDQSVLLENPQKARLYLICGTPLGTALNDPVNDGNDYVGTIGPKSFLCWERDPGNTTIYVNPHGKWTNSCKVSMNVQRGNVYYIQLHTIPGFMVPIYAMDVMDMDKGKRLLGRCNPAKNAK